MSAGTGGNAIVVGAGLAGLTAAWRLVQRGFDVTVLEAAERVGGCIATTTTAGFLFESGPNSMRGSSLALASLVTGLGLEHERVLANPTDRHAWIWRRGERHALPSSPPALVRTKLISTRGKLRLLAEPFLPAWKGPPTATIADFLGARLGPEALTALVDPFMGGVFAGDPAHLGLDAFPFLQTAAEKGGLARALPTLAAKRTGGRRERGGARASTFRDGLATLPRALAAAIGPTRIRTGARVARLSLGATGGHAVVLADGATLTTDRLVLATPPASLAALLGEPTLDIPTASVVTVGLGLRRHDLPVEPDGFGVLLASDSPLGEVLGVVFTSAIFSGRAPDDHLTLTCVIGGVRFPEAIGRPDAEVVAAATQAVEAVFGCRGRLEPQAVHVARWPGGIPQIPPGHTAALAAVRQRLPRGVALAGAIDGPGLDPVTVSGLAAADAVSV